MDYVSLKVGSGTENLEWKRRREEHSICKKDFHEYPKIKQGPYFKGQSLQECLRQEDETGSSYEVCLSFLGLA